LIILTAALAPAGAARLLWVFAAVVPLHNGRVPAGRSNQNTEAHARISDMRCGEVEVGALKLYGLHSSFLLAR
jgi:hypothetical protein